MANSNVRSSEYRAAGGRAWHRHKPKSGIRWTGPKTETQVIEDQAMLDQADQYYQEKAKVRESLASGYDASLVTVVKAGASGKKKSGATKRKNKGRKSQRKYV